MRFDLFIGIDWSGGQAEHQKGIQVAEMGLGVSAPCLIDPPHPKGWSRASVISHLNAHKAQGKRVLAGIDFAFCHAYADKGEYFPSYAESPKTPSGLWQLVDQTCQDFPHYYGGGIWGHRQLRQYYNAPICRDGRGGKGVRFQSRRRKTEMIAAEVNNRTPSPTFNCVGAAGVGTGSLAGMRMLHAMEDDAWIWPLSDAEKVKSLKAQSANEGLLALVEIYPALYFTMAGVKDAFKKAAPLDALNQGLTFFGAEPIASIAENLPDHDDIDAMISAAALRSLHDPQDIFPISDQDRPAAMREGWIFGAGSSKTSLC